MLRLLKPEELAGRGARGAGNAAGGAGGAVYERECQRCHGAGRSGSLDAPSLVGVGTRMTAAALRNLIANGSGEMPSFRQLSDADLDAVIQFLSSADSAIGARAGARGRGAPPLVFPAGPVVASGSAAVRPPPAGRGAAPAYPDGMVAPPNRYTINGYGTIPTAMKPPYTTLTSYDLNRGTIKWQIGLGDDLRLIAKGITGTGTAQQMKTGVMPTAGGLVFVTSGDNRLRALDADTGRELWSASLGAPTQGSPAMYELDGRQYVLVTASDVGLRYGRLPGAPATTGPTGYTAFALAPPVKAARRP